MEKAIPAKLHVLTLTPFYPSDGDEVSGCFVAEILRELRVYGVASSVIAVDSIYHAQPKDKPGILPPTGFAIRNCPETLACRAQANFLGAVLLAKVRSFIGSSPIHVIHAHAALPCGHAAALLSRRLGIPFVVTIHGLDVFNSCFQKGIAAAMATHRVLERFTRAQAR